MVRADYRGRIGGELLIRSLAFMAYAAFYRDDHCGAGYGLPSEIAGKVGRKLLQYIPLDPIIYLTQALSTAPATHGVRTLSPRPTGDAWAAASMQTSAHPMPERASAELTFTPIERFAAEADSIWQARAGDYAVTLVKDSAYLNWRYVHCPDTAYAKFVIQRGDLPVGIIVLSTNFAGEQANFPIDTLAALVEWIVPQAYAVDAGQIAQFCEQWCADRRLSRLIAMFPIRSQEYGCFKQLGYTEFESRYRLMAKSFDAEVSIACRGHLGPGGR